MLRIVVSGDTEAKLDDSGRSHGRGAYICCSEDCINGAYEKGLISREEAVSELKDRGLPFGLWTKLPDLPSSGDKDTAC